MASATAPRPDKRTVRINELLSEVKALKEQVATKDPPDTSALRMKLSQAEFDRDEARNLTKGFKEQLEALKENPAPTKITATEFAASERKFDLVPLTWKVPPSSQNPGEPGMTTFFFENRPGRFFYIEEMSFAELNGHSVDQIMVNAHAAVDRAVNPNCVIAGLNFNRLQIVNGQPTALGKFSRSNKMRVTIELICPDVESGY